MQKHYYILFIFSALFFSCKTEPAKCKYKPSPIFDAKLPGVQAYNFEVQGNQSLESILLETGTLLEIYQEVCNSTKQEYRLNVNGDFSQFADSTWIKEASRQLVYLSTFSPAQAPLKAWADMIEAHRSKMKLAEAYEMQAGITVKVDRVLSPEKGTLLIEFAQE
jgi:hypothetical protein